MHIKHTHSYKTYKSEYKADQAVHNTISHKPRGPIKLEENCGPTPITMEPINFGGGLFQEPITHDRKVGTLILDHIGAATFPERLIAIWQIL